MVFLVFLVGENENQELYLSWFSGVLWKSSSTCRARHVELDLQSTPENQVMAHPNLIRFDCSRFPPRPSYLSCALFQNTEN